MVTTLPGPIGFKQALERAGVWCCFRASAPQFTQGGPGADQCREVSQIKTLALPGRPQKRFGSCQGILDGQA